MLILGGIYAQNIWTDKDRQAETFENILDFPEHAMAFHITIFSNFST